VEVEPIETSKRHAVIVAQIEARIMGGQLAVGDALPVEAELARSFNVSTRSVRDALQILETKGLIERRHGGRTVVIRNDISFFVDSLSQSVKQLFATEESWYRDLMEVRRLLEVPVAGLIAASASKRDFSAIEGALESLRQAVSARDLSAMSRADASFHLALISILGNRLLTKFYQSLYGLIQGEIATSNPVTGKDLEVVYAEHLELLQVLKSGDRRAAEDAFGQHIDGSTAYLNMALKG
jgi:GntR family transcriptional repressor for pyruvate dehydrogenase complex